MRIVSAERPSIEREYCPGMAWPELDHLGPFFTLQTGTQPDSWRPVADLASDDRPLRTRVAATRAQLGGGTGAELPARVAASAAQLGLTAHLVSPALAGAALAGVVPDLSAARTWWSVDRGSVFAVPELDVRAVTGVDDTVEALLELVLGGSVSALVRATSGVTSVAEQILWGNVASSLAGAGSVIGASHPDLATRCREIVAAVVATPLLAGSGRYRGTRFRRSTCCLYYVVPGGGLCRDCVLAHPPSLA